jgi:N,N'-diacetyllegionaminate synthase
LIRSAGEAGADAVKVQLFHPDRLLSEQAVLAGYQQGKAKGVKELLGDLALGVEAIRELGVAAREAGLVFVVTPFSLGDAEDLKRIEVDAVKIASPDAVNLPLLEAVSGLGKPILISTGTCRLEELGPVVELIERHRAGGCLLQCVSSYPTPTGEAALGGMSAMRQRFGVPVGYSDHTGETFTGALAVAAGAVVIEKHLTYDRKAKGPDHAASLDARGFAAYVDQVRQAQRMLGPINKTVKPIEMDVRTVSRQSVCAVRDLPAGHRLGREDLTVKRPGTGIPAARLKNIVGQTLTRAVQANHLLNADDVTPISTPSPASSTRLAC